MNCPVKTEPIVGDGYNQNPPAYPAELTTRNTLNHRANEVHNSTSRTALSEGIHDAIADPIQAIPPKGFNGPGEGKDGFELKVRSASSTSSPDDEPAGKQSPFWTAAKSVRSCLAKYARFIGPGFMVSVAYIDPGNYATDVSAGATYKFKLLFMILLSNIFAIFLQALCIKLGTVTGMNLAENCKAHLPRWLNYVLYFFAEAAIIATDIAEVIGTAIALNLLFHLPLVAGCAISILDVMIILFFYNSAGMSMKALRCFEVFVMLLVLGVAVCFCFELSLVDLSKVGSTVGDVFRGYLPSSALVESEGLYQSCGILGATVMPHSLYLGSGIVQNRLRDFDQQHKKIANGTDASSDKAVISPGRLSIDSRTSSEEETKYRPSLAAIKSCLNYSIAELTISLFTFALFINSAILIVAGASLSDTPDAQDADLFSIHDLLSKTLAPAAGTIFALALLLSGTSAGIVCTIAGQMVSEGQLNWTMKPWMRRLITRSISITPSIIIAGAVGRDGLSTALEASQVALSIILPFVSAPLIWFTCRSSIMSVFASDEGAGNNLGEAVVAPVEDSSAGTATSTATALDIKAVELPGTVRDISGGEAGIAPSSTARLVIMRNHWVTAVFAILIWLVIVVMNVALLVLLGLGKN